MQTITVHQVDSFTDTLFGGNPAGVVLEAQNLSPDEMQKIAREMNLSETAFLHPATRGGDFSLRYFTPTSEIKFCGHATVAALFEMARTGMFGTTNIGEYRFKVETGGGDLQMDVRKSSPTEIEISFASPRIDLVDSGFDHKTMAGKLGVPVSALDQDKPIMHERMLNNLYIPIRSLKELGDLTFNFQQIIENFRSDETVVFALLTAETFSPENHIHVRALAPLVGVNEDPVTGSIQGGLGAYAIENGLVDPATKLIKVEQGNFVGRPGFLTVEPIKDADGFRGRITGTAVHVFSAEMTLPAKFECSCF